MLSETQKKFLTAIMVGIGIVSLFSAVVDSPTIPASDTVDIPEATALVQEMPESSSYTYGTEEYVVINDLTAKGMVLRQYKRTFTNMSHRNYDVEQTYRDFDKDMEQYARYLKQGIMELRSQRPARGTSMQSQADTVARAEQLYRKVAEYKNHEDSVRDTLDYLADCIYEMERLSQQAKLPR